MKFSLLCGLITGVAARDIGGVQPELPYGNSQISQGNYGSQQGNSQRYGSNNQPYGANNQPIGTTQSYDSNQQYATTYGTSTLQTGSNQQYGLRDSTIVGTVNSWNPSSMQSGSTAQQNNDATQSITQNSSGVPQNSVTTLNSITSQSSTPENGWAAAKSSGTPNGIGPTPNAKPPNTPPSSYGQVGQGQAIQGQDVPYRPSEKTDTYEDIVTKYLSKTCKYHPPPRDLTSLAYTRSDTGELQVGDTFGFPRASKEVHTTFFLREHSVVTVTIETSSSAEETMPFKVFAENGAEMGEANMIIGFKGQYSRAVFQSGLDAGKYKISFQLEGSETSLETSDAEKNTVDKKSCVEARLDIAAVPDSVKQTHWPENCHLGKIDPPRRGAPSGFSASSALSMLWGGPIDLGDTVLALDSRSDTSSKILDNKIKAPYIFPLDPRLDNESSPNTAQFSVPVWSITVKAAARLHRFVRVYFKIAFRFGAVPLMLILERFNYDDEGYKDQAKPPDCNEHSCYGGAIAGNAQILDHAMPTGFVYKIHIMALSGFTEVWKNIDPSQKCLEYDLDYRISYETKITPFEVGPVARMCQHTVLPNQSTAAFQDLSKTQVVGRSIHLRDHFGFPTGDEESMEHNMVIVVTEESFFRASVYQTSSATSVYFKLFKHSPNVDENLIHTLVSGEKPEAGQNDMKEICKSVKNRDQQRRVTIFCRLDPGAYTLVVFSYYALGGVHPCQYFQAQVALKPLSMIPTSSTKDCANPSPPEMPLNNLQIKDSNYARWIPYQHVVELTASDQPQLQTVWQYDVIVQEEDMQKRPYLKLAIHSDFLTADFRFAVKNKAGQEIMEPTLISNGYSNLIDVSREPDTYTVTIYYVKGQNTGGSMFWGHSDIVLCPRFQVDCRVIWRAGDQNFWESKDAIAKHYEDNAGKAMGQVEASEHDFERAMDPMSLLFGEETLAVDPHAVWLCKVGLPGFPSKIVAHTGETTVIDAIFAVPSGGNITSTIFVPEEFLLKVSATTQSGENFGVAVEFVNAPKNNGVGVYQADHDGQFLAVLSPGNPNNADLLKADAKNPAKSSVRAFSLKLQRMHSGVGKEHSVPCAKVRINLVLQPFSSTPICPWAAGQQEKNKAAIDASSNYLKERGDSNGAIVMQDFKKLLPDELVHMDHYQNDHGSKSINVWMDAVHNSNSRFHAASEAVLRVEADVQPPWIPVRLKLWKMQSTHKNRREEVPVTISKSIESRQLLIAEQLEEGTYEVEMLTVDPKKRSDMAKALCSHVRVTAFAALKDEESRAQLREELIESPELWPLLLFPNHMNQIGLYDRRKFTAQTVAYRFGTTLKNSYTLDGKRQQSVTAAADDAVNHFSDLYIPEPTLVRIYGEPLDLVETTMAFKITEVATEQIAYQTDSSAVGVGFVLQPGFYRVEARSKVAYLVTLGFASENVAWKSFKNVETCNPQPPPLPQVDMTQHVWNMPLQHWQIRPQANSNAWTYKLKIKLAVPSVLFLEMGSNYVADHGTMSVKVKEGIMAGEQRAFASNLQLELEKGEHTLLLRSDMSLNWATQSNVLAAHCVDLDFRISAVSLEMEVDLGAQLSGSEVLEHSTETVAKALEEVKEDESAALNECDDGQAAAFPADFAPNGGSEQIGGPLDDETGRMLVRSRILLTDIHAGRRKAFIAKPSGLSRKTYNSMSRPEDKTLVIKIQVQYVSAEDNLILEMSKAVGSKKFDAKAVVKPVDKTSGSKGFTVYYTMDVADLSLVGYWMTIRNADTGCMVFDFAMHIQTMSELQANQQCTSKGSPMTLVEFMPPLSVDKGVLTPPYRYQQPPQLVSYASSYVFMSFSVMVHMWISLEVKSNFGLSNIEMKLFMNGNGDESSQPVNDEYEFTGNKEDQLTMKSWFGTVLSPGTYSIQMMDDLTETRFWNKDSTNMENVCLPLSVSFLAIPMNQPSILSIQPGGGFPLCQDCNEVTLRIRFSEPMHGAAGNNNPIIMLGNHVPKVRSDGEWFDREDDGRVWILKWDAKLLEKTNRLALTVDGGRIISEESNARVNTNWEVDASGLLPQYAFANTGGQVWISAQGMLMLQNQRTRSNTIPATSNFNSKMSRGEENAIKNGWQNVQNVPGPTAPLARINTPPSRPNNAYSSNQQQQNNNRNQEQQQNMYGNQQQNMYGNQQQIMQQNNNMQQYGNNNQQPYNNNQQNNQYGQNAQLQYGNNNQQQYGNNQQYRNSNQQQYGQNNQQQYGNNNNQQGRANYVNSYRQQQQQNTRSQKTQTTQKPQQDYVGGWGENDDHAPATVVNDYSGGPKSMMHDLDDTNISGVTEVRPAPKGWQGNKKQQQGAAARRTNAQSNEDSCSYFYVWNEEKSECEFFAYPYFTYVMGNIGFWFQITALGVLCAMLMAVIKTVRQRNATNRDRVAYQRVLQKDGIDDDCDNDLDDLHNVNFKLEDDEEMAEFL